MYLKEEWKWKLNGSGSWTEKGSCIEVEVEWKWKLDRNGSWIEMEVG